jgi:hypothetical protein
LPLGEPPQALSATATNKAAANSKCRGQTSPEADNTVAFYHFAVQWQVSARQSMGIRIARGHSTSADDLKRLDAPRCRCKSLGGAFPESSAVRIVGEKTHYVA